MQRELQRLNWLTVKKLVPAKIDTIILPVGTMEAHGAACLGTDNFIPESIADAIAERVNALVAPLVNYGITRSLYRFNGSLNIKPENFGPYINDILSSLADIGFKNIILMNGHGGNNGVLKNVAAEFHQQVKVNVAVVHWWQLCQEMTNEFFGHAGGHAGTDETAMVQAVDDELAGESDYDAEQAWHFKPGADIYPVPGTILLYKEGEGFPNFDLAQAKEYQAKVFEAIGEFVELIISRWRKLGL